METYEKLRSARIRIGITQDYVAKQLNVPRTAIVQMENGSRKIASEELSTLCDLYGLSADYALGKNDYDNPSIRFIARSFESLSEEDQQEVASLIEFKKEMAERRKKQQREA